MNRKIRLRRLANSIKLEEIYRRVIFLSLVSPENFRYLLLAFRHYEIINKVFVFLSYIKLNFMTVPENLLPSSFFSRLMLQIKLLICEDKTNIYSNYWLAVEVVF